MAIFLGRLYGASGFGGLEQWNGTVEWNGGMEQWNEIMVPHPLPRLC